MLGILSILSWHATLIRKWLTLLSFCLWIAKDLYEQENR
jgi:hypothetical protein